MWESEDAARRFFSDELLERVTGLYGVRPQVEFAEIVEMVDNSAVVRALAAHRARRSGLAAGERDELGQVVGGLGHRHLRAVVAARAQHLVHRLHVREHLAHDLGIE